MKKTLTIIMLLCFVVSAAAENTVRMDEDVYNVDQGDTFDVTILASTDDNTSGFSMWELSWDPAILRVNSVNKGDDIWLVFGPGTLHDDHIQQAEIGMVGGDPRTGDLTVFVISFTALKKGTTNLDFTGMGIWMLDWYGAPMSLTYYNSSVIVNEQPNGGNGGQPPPPPPPPPPEPPNIDPVADITVSYNNGTTNETVILDGANSYDTDGIIVSYEWDFGDGAITTGKTVNHIYKLPGDYMVTLLVTDNEGGTDYDSVLITITQGEVKPPDEQNEPNNKEQDGNGETQKEHEQNYLLTVLFVIGIIVAVLFMYRFRRKIKRFLE